MHRFFDPVVHQLIDTPARAMPGAAADLYWCYQFLTAAMTLTSPEIGRIDHVDGLRAGRPEARPASGSTPTARAASRP